MVISPIHQSTDLFGINTDSSELGTMEPYVFSYTKPNLLDKWGLVVEIEADGYMVIDEILSGGVIDKYQSSDKNSLQIGDLIISVNGNIIPIELAEFKRLMKNTEVQLKIFRFNESIG
jgi:hypothetical protein